MKRLVVLVLLSSVPWLLACPTFHDDELYACRADRDCPDAMPCDTAAGRCVECLEDEHCEDGELCIDLSCGPCTVHEQCTAEGAPWCEDGGGECVECLEDEHCEEGWSCVNGACTPECEDAGDCAGTGRPHCNEDLGICQECLEHQSCVDNDDGRDWCNEDAECVECLEHQNCVDNDDGRDWCNHGGECVDVEPCARQGFSAHRVRSVWEDGSSPVLEYSAEGDGEFAHAELRIFWWFDDGLEWTGTGIYQVEDDSTPRTCSFCVEIEVLHLGACEQRFFAAEGQVEIEEIGSSYFKGRLVDARLVEWECDGEQERLDGQSWCIDEHTWQTAIVNNPFCSSTDDCGGDDCVDARCER